MKVAAGWYCLPAFSSFFLSLSWKQRQRLQNWRKSYKAIFKIIEHFRPFWRWTIEFTGVCGEKNDIFSTSRQAKKEIIILPLKHNPENLWQHGTIHVFLPQTVWEKKIFKEGQNSLRRVADESDLTTKRSRLLGRPQSRYLFYRLNFHNCFSTFYI